ncbi:recombinase family protein [Helicobacter sp. 11S02629-2]|uniref:recombinase family protein n=1 Tax=Helicobacter sp. 11S02629-2 TaxID=1476195 RepID=UPI000BA5D063|nr:recombinase family protein [Helicobacter sp. 11S02629-2]PAF45608.1 invertase [Helicobacter sp. 11S02629-2]
MIYAYIRVSSDRQTVENQRFEIETYAKKQGLAIDEMWEETMSGKIAIDHRKLGLLRKKLKKGDLLLVPELSRLGRSLLNVMSFLNECVEKGVQIYSLKEKFELGDNIQSKVIAFAFSLSAEIERTLISQRTKEALARLRAEGVVLGRPKGAKTRIELHPCYHAMAKILEWDAKGMSHANIAKRVGVHRDSLRRFLIASGNKNLLKGRNY